MLKGVARELGRAEMSPCTKSGRDATRRRTGENPGTESRVPTLSEVRRAERYEVSGAESEKRTNPGWTFGSLSGS